MIVLDTNVISEVFRPEPEHAVITWLLALEGEVAITAVTLAELLTGIARLQDGARKDALSTSIELTLEPYRAGGAILPFDDAAASAHAEILTARDRAGHPISTADAQIAAICRAHQATLATHNTTDFAGTGIDLINPWDS